MNTFDYIYKIGTLLLLTGILLGMAYFGLSKGQKGAAELVLRPRSAVPAGCQGADVPSVAPDRKDGVTGLGGSQGGFFLSI